jgi:hypothetical protein
VIEVKGTAEDVYAIARGEQVQRYCARYGQVLVTNLRDFLLVARHGEGAVALSGWSEGCGQPEGRDQVGCSEGGDVGDLSVPDSSTEIEKGRNAVSLGWRR